MLATSLILLRVAVPADAAEPGAWLADKANREFVRSALQLIPFTGITFLWFMGVLRNRIGDLEDRFFATVFLGSGFLFVAMLLTSAAVAQALLETFPVGPRSAAQSEVYEFGRRVTYFLMTTFGLKMAAVFMFVTSMIGFRTGALSRLVTSVGFTFAVIFLVVVTQVPWLTLLFPAWVMLASTWILVTDFRQPRQSRMTAP
jgi:hypothetical protein